MLWIKGDSVLFAEYFVFSYNCGWLTQVEVVSGQVFYIPKKLGPECVIWTKINTRTKKMSWKMRTFTQFLTLH